jgi:hypothetical protein
MVAVRLTVCLFAQQDRGMAVQVPPDPWDIIIHSFRKRRELQAILFASYSDFQIFFDFSPLITKNTFHCSSNKIRIIATTRSEIPKPEASRNFVWWLSLSSIWTCTRTDGHTEAVLCECACTLFTWWFLSYPITDLDRPWGFQEAETPRFQDIRHMQVVSLSALRTGRIYLPG